MLRHYPDGQKQSLIPGDKVLNGEYKLWYPSGQLSFSGYYKENLKDGEFERFDEYGRSLNKGVYKDGKLVSGENVLAEIIYTDPDIPAEYEGGEEALSQLLTQKISNPDAPRMTFLKKEFPVYIAFGKDGKVFDIKSAAGTDSKEDALIKYLLKDCPPFRPALVEGIPVQSQQQMSLDISLHAVSLSAGEKIYTKVDEMPEFPGGEQVLLTFITSNIKYPKDALAAKIEGKVLVSFVVDKTGKVTNIRVVKGVHPSLDAEASRVVASMPLWTPGRNEGRPVKVAYTFPVNFRLQ